VVPDIATCSKDAKAWQQKWLFVEMVWQQNWLLVGSSVAAEMAAGLKDAKV